MEANNWRPATQPDQPAADGTSADWRSQLLPDARQRIVNKIMDTLKRHLPISVPEGINELKKIALRFEEKIYTAATSQSDYLRKISLKMLSMETKTQTTTGMNPSPSNVVIGNQSTTDSGSAGVQAALPSIAGLGQSTISGVGQTSNLQNMPGMSQNSINNPAGQGTTSNLYANAQRQIQGRQQQQTMISQQHQQQSQNPLMYQHPLQQQLLKQKMSHAMQQQQQQSLFQPTSLQSSQQQPLMQMSSSMQSGQSTIQQTQPAISAPQSNLQQQNQQSSIQQPVSSMLQQQPQSVTRQQLTQSTIHHQAGSHQQQSTPMSQQSILSSQQQQQIMGQPSNLSNMQQSQLLGQQNSVPDIQQQQQQQQQQRLSAQQNALLGMQQSQQILNQQNLSLHQQQQIGQQNNLPGLQQQQQLLGSQPNVSSMQQPLQRSMNILQQNKSVAQQQSQQPSMTILQSQGQQSQLLSSHQQLMPQIQSQPAQLQQQMAIQQQTNSLQREMQHRFQASGALLQSQNVIDHQKQFIQTQRGLPEVSSSTSLDSTAQTGNAVVGDWQEELYQKIKSMKEMYLVELNQLHQKISMKFQLQENSSTAAKQTDQYKKMENFKGLLERSIAFLQIPKNGIQPNFRDKIPMFEKQIVQFIATNRGKKIPSQLQVQQQFQQPGGHTLSMPQQQPSQVPQLQQYDNHVNQVQQMNLQGPGTSMQSAVSSMQHGSVPVSQLGVPTSQQNITNMMQPVPNMDPAHGTSFGSLQQQQQHGGVGSLQNSINAPQQTNMNSLSQSSMSTLQPNVGPMQQGPNILQQQQLKQQQQQQEQQQQLLQSQQMKQQLQQRQMQQQLMQQQQKHQLLQQQPTLQQQLLQQKQQQTSPLQMHQMTQLNQMNDVNEMKLRQASNMKAGLYQQHYTSGQRHTYFHPQLKPGAFPISSPQTLQASSPQISQHSSPQIDQHGLLSSHTKIGTPLQSTSSPFVVPSPSTPVAPSPIPGDSEKQHSGMTSLPNAAIGHQQSALAVPQQQSLAVGTPGISASPLLAEFTSPDGNQTNALTTISGKSAATERPLDRLIKAVQSISPKALTSSISDIGSVVSMTDRIAGSAPGNGSRAAVGEDLVAMTKCRLQARNFMLQDGSAATKKMKRHTSAMPLNAVSSTSSMNDSFKQSYGVDISEFESTASSSVKRQKTEVNHSLLEEIREINQQLIETVVSINDEDVESIAAAASIGEGTVVKLSFSAVACSPSLKAQFASAQTSPITPLRLLVPANYPKCSPILLDKLPVEPSQEFEDLSTKARSRFHISLRALSQPMLLREMARTWDVCARKVIAEFAQQMGGGTFSSKYGTWENCVSA